MIKLDLMLMDMLGAFLAFILFLLFLFPVGYLVSFLFDLFQFRCRVTLARCAISTITSVAIMPIIAFLLAYFMSLYVVIYFSLMFLFIFIALIVWELTQNFNYKIYQQSKLTALQKTKILIAVFWVILVIVVMIDLQWGDQLYNNITSLDFATRATLVDAITRTGVPPVNPSYYPGHPEFITSLYYFWYVLCSVVDIVGGNLVDGRMALIAGDAWCGLAIMGLVALYLKLRDNLKGEHALRVSLIGISLLTVSGIDFIPALINMLTTRIVYGYSWPLGDVEQWNEQITAWIGSLLWVPHHVAALIACVFAFMVIFYHRNQTNVLRRCIYIMLSGLALASAVGLSTWVTMVFAVFWGGAAFLSIFRNREANLFLPMIATGVISVIFAFPFLSGVLLNGVGTEAFPVIFEVRRFVPVAPFLEQLPYQLQNFLHLLVLPVNYMMELGFFMIVGLLWLQEYYSGKLKRKPIFYFEICLLLSVIVICSLFRSAIVSSNEIGWRGWLLGQFILLIWAVDVLEIYPVFSRLKNKVKQFPDGVKASSVHILAFFVIVGVTTSVVDVVLLRFWAPMVDHNIPGFPNGLSPDAQLGRRTHSARLAYTFIRDQLPMEVVIQPNPQGGVDRQSGLYGTRQLAISSNAPFNVPFVLLDQNINYISKIFEIKDEQNWKRIDKLCSEMFIDVIVVDDLDVLWGSLPRLSQQRKPLYKNDYFAVFSCGNFTASSLP